MNDYRLVSLSPNLAVDTEVLRKGIGYEKTSRCCINEFKQQGLLTELIHAKLILEEGICKM
jgi:hypothetical protein